MFPTTGYLGLGSNPTLSNTKYAEVWRKMRHCWAPCMGKQGNDVVCLAGSSVRGVPTTGSGAVWGYGYPYTYWQAGDYLANPGEFITSTGTGTLNFEKGFCVETFFYSHMDFGAGGGYLLSYDFDTSPGTLSFNLRVTNQSTGQITLGWASGGTLSLTNMLNKFCHIIVMVPGRTGVATQNSKMGGMVYGDNKLAIITGNNGVSTQTLTAANFNRVSMARRLTGLTTSYSARYSFQCCYENIGWWDERFVLNRLKDPFGLFGLNQRPVGKAATVSSTFLPGQPFPGLPFPILAM